MSDYSSYLLSYEPQPYAVPTPMQKDIDLIKIEEPDCHIEVIRDVLILVEFVKYFLDLKLLSKLRADQIFELREGCFWHLIDK